MSRIGNARIQLPQGVTLLQKEGVIVVRGPKGEVTVALVPGIVAKQEQDMVIVTSKTSEQKAKAGHGLVRALVANAVLGVTKGWTKTLELSGVGYRVAMTGTSITLSVGFSHPVVIVPPQGITFQIVEGKIVVSGIDRQMVGEIAAKIRRVKEPEPYKGKGIKYVGEVIRKKAGKAAKAVGAGATK